MPPHDVNWTPSKVSAFWDDYADRRPEDLYFSRLLAPALAGWIARNARPSKDRLLLDLGCGGGHLLHELKRRGYRPFGVDSSPASIAAAAKRIGVQNVAQGGVSHIPLDSNSVGGVLLIETIEHVLDMDLEQMIVEIRRVLQPGAPLVVTTPNSEHLDSARVTCPDCGARFHPMQHVRSWTPQSLMGFLERNGFRNVQTFELNLPVGRGPIVIARRLLYWMRGDKPLLFAIARD